MIKYQANADAHLIYLSQMALIASVATCHNTGILQEEHVSAALLVVLSMHQLKDAKLLHVVKMLFMIQLAIHAYNAPAVLI